MPIDYVVNEKKLKIPSIWCANVHTYICCASYTSAITITYLRVAVLAPTPPTPTPPSGDCKTAWNSHYAHYSTFPAGSVARLPRTARRSAAHEEGVCKICFFSNVSISFLANFRFRLNYSVSTYTFSIYLYACMYIRQCWALPLDFHYSVSLLHGKQG